jgi:hypothetical protein
VVEKIGEMEAYNQTLRQIDNIVGKGKVEGKSLTGPFEFMSNIVDKYDVADLGDEDRINLRTLVARLPGVMYAMRGKQLSDKELEVALKMMPTMDMEDKAFAIALTNFSDYMNRILKSKSKAFEEAGYKPPAGSGGKSVSDMSDDEIKKQLGIQ